MSESPRTPRDHATAVNQTVFTETLGVVASDREPSPLRPGNLWVEYYEEDVSDIAHALAEAKGFEEPMPDEWAKAGALRSHWRHAEIETSPREPSPLPAEMIRAAAKEGLCSMVDADAMLQAAGVPALLARIETQQQEIAELRETKARAR